MSPLDFKLILADPKAELCDAWRSYFSDCSKVSIHHGCFEEVQRYDCMVSAANSFGLMDGGVDMAIINYFGFELMDRVQARIIDEYRGEQPIGTSMIVETGHRKHPFIAHTPTMRVPMSISKTDNVYLAMWAMLLAVWRHNQQGRKPIKTVVCPGLGTATGQVSYNQAAKLMFLAYMHFEDPPKSISWPYADNRQKSIGVGGDIVYDGSYQ